MSEYTLTQNDADDFVDYLLRVDESSVILKTHLKLEQGINAALRGILLKPSVVTDWSFLDKINVLAAVGFLEGDIVKNFKGFNNLRNKFSHRYRYRLSPEDIHFLEGVGSNQKVTIPDNLNKIPYIKNITLIVRTGAHLEGWLDGRLFLLRQK